VTAITINTAPAASIRKERTERKLSGRAFQEAVAAGESGSLIDMVPLG
jgi:hypothetical protein